MRFKIFFIGLVCFFTGIKMFSQQSILPKNESVNLRVKLIEKSKSTTSIQSDFIQYKHLDFLSKDIKSTGNLAFKSPELIKWEYKEPFNYIVIFKDKKLHINDSGSKSEVDLGSSKTFASLNALIIKSVTGDMFDEKMFEISYFYNESKYIVKFKPLDSLLSNFINEFVLFFDKESLRVVGLKMIESTEDYTLINFLNQKFNQSINDEVFNK